MHHLDRRLLPSGFLGVDIFFVISGFVISGSLSRGGAADLPSHLLGFYARRVRRLVPALAVCVLLTAVLLCLVNPTPARILDTGLWALFGLANVSLHNQATDYFGLSADLNVFTHTWSLGVEEQFYLLFPLLVWWSGCARGPRAFGAAPARRLTRWLLLLSAASLLSFVVLGRSRPEAAYFLMPARFWELGAGCLLFLIRGDRLPAALRRWLPPALLAPLLLTTLLLPRSLITASTVACVLLTALLIGGIEPAGGVRQGLRHPWLVGLGRISYSLYLWHWSVIALSHWTIGIQPWTVPLQLALMLILAIASYRLVEQPLRQRRWSERPGGTVARGLGVMAAAAAILALLAGPLQGALYAGDRPRAARAAWLAANSIPGTDLTAERCERLGPRTGRDCVLPPRPGSPTLLVMGDSHAQHLYPLLGVLRQRHGIGVRTLAPGGGVFPPLADGSSRRPDDLRAFYRQQAPLLRRGDALLLSSHLGPLTEGRDPLLRQWAEAVRELAGPLRARGVTVVVLLPLPEFAAPADPYPSEACLPEWFRPRPQPGCAIRLEGERQRLRERSLRVRRAVESVLAGTPDVLLFDGFDQLCPASMPRCRSRRGAVTLFRDHDHLTLDGSLALVEPFETFLRQQRLLPAAAAGNAR